MNGVNDKLIRAVTHRDVTPAQCAEAADAFAEVVAAATVSAR